MFCPECGQQHADGAKFCAHCGAKITRDHGQVQGRAQKQQEYKLGTFSDSGYIQPTPQQPEGSLINPNASFKQKHGLPKPDGPSRLMKNKHDLRILLVGRTGHGKSATGNSLLGIKREEGFVDELSRISVTKEFKSLTTQRFGRQLEVVDTPGLLDTSADQRFVYEQIANCIAMTLPGFHAICLVLRPDRFTAELVKTVEIFYNVFGHGIGEYAFVLFTHMETEANLNKYINEGDKKIEDDGEKAFQVLRKRCQDKLLFIDNKASKDDKEEMVWNILTAVDEANAKASKPYFQNKRTKVIVQKAKHFYDAHVLCLGSKRAKEDLRILLLGLPGHGKSATGNSLLGKSLFPENAPTEGNTEKMTHSWENNGRKIQIVEFPVTDPSSQSDEDLRDQFIQTQTMLHPGFHAVCFVIDPNKMSDVKDQFKGIMEYFGDEASDYAFVLMTFTKHEDEFDRSFRSNIEAEHPVTSVLEFCKDKELYIDNKASPQEKEEMIKEMFNSIDSANAAKRIPYFSSLFKQQTEAAEALNKKYKEEFQMLEQTVVTEAAEPAPYEELQSQAEKKHKEELQRKQQTEAAKAAEELHNKYKEELQTQQQTVAAKAAESLHKKYNLKEELQRQHYYYQGLIAHLSIQAAEDAEAAEIKHREDLKKESEVFEAYKKKLKKKKKLGNVRLYNSVESNKMILTFYLVAQII